MDKLEFEQWQQVNRFNNWKTSFRREAITGSTHLRQAADWFSKIDQATSTQHVDEAGSVFGCTRTQLEALDSKIAKGSKQRLQSEFMRKVEVADEMQEKKGLPMLTGRQIAFFRSNDTKGGAIGMNDLLNIELRSATLKIFDRAWEEKHG